MRVKNIPCDWRQANVAALLDQIRQIVEQVILTVGYAGIGLVMLVENIIPPIPSEFVMPFAGFLVSQEELSYAGVVIAGTLGAVLGAVVIYYVGRVTGEDRVREWTRKYGRYILMGENDLDRGMDIFERYGDAIVLFGRIIPIVRSLVSLPAGVKEMNLPKFLLFTTIGSLIWNGILAYTGLALGHHWESVLHYMDMYEYLIFGVLGLLVLMFLVRKVSRKQTT